MYNILKNINNRTYKIDNTVVIKEINSIKRDNKKIVTRLQDMDYLYMDCKEFELGEYIRNLLEYHPICEDTLFSCRTGKLVITKDVISYTLDKAKAEGYDEEELEELKEALNLGYKYQENEKTMAILEEMKDRRSFSPKLRFDNNTQSIVSGDKIDFESGIVQKLTVLSSKSVERIKFNEIYLKVLADMVGISEEEYLENKKANKGCLTEMTFKDEVKNVFLLISEHIANDKIAEVSQQIFKKGLRLNLILEGEVRKKSAAEINNYVKQIVTDTNKVLNINSYEVVLEK